MMVAVKRLSAGLHNIGVVKGDVIGTYIGNRIEFVWLWLAALRLGAIITTCNTAYTPGRYSLHDS
jgi:acyl-coenzyme A synthetase/AMP-(fatty) acid ligase